MTLAGVKPGDIVLVNDGMPYHAEVIAKNGSLQVRVIGRPTVVKTAKARDVVAHWRRSKAK